MEADGAPTFSQGFFLDEEGGEECKFNFWLSHQLLSSSGWKAPGTLEWWGLMMLTRELIT